MSAGASTIEFVPLAHRDLELMASWLHAPHWREWWGEPDAELDHVVDMIEGRDSTRPYLFHVDGVPLGYIQLWFIADQRRHDDVLAEHPWLSLLADDTVGVDLSIGDPARLSQGIGSCTLRLFTERLSAQGHATIIIDPDPDNRRAVRAYEKASFRAVPHLIGRTGDSHIMQFEPTAKVDAA